MTIAWAIIAVAVLYLLDKHHLLKKALIGAGIMVAVVAVGYAGILGYQKLEEQWDDYQFARRNECYSPSTGKIHPINSSGPSCGYDEQVHQRGTPMPVVPSSGTTYDNMQGGSVADQQRPAPPAGYRLDDVWEFKQAGPFRYFKSADGIYVNELCSQVTVASGKSFCYRTGWQMWLKGLERNTAGLEAKALDADTGTESPGTLVLTWDNQQRVVFTGCRSHSCPDADAFFIVSPRTREIDIVWHNEKGVTYLGPNASLLRANNGYELLSSLPN